MEKPLFLDLYEGVVQQDPDEFTLMRKMNTAASDSEKAQFERLLSVSFGQWCQGGKRSIYPFRRLRSLSP